MFVFTAFAKFDRRMLCTLYVTCFGTKLILLVITHVLFTSYGTRFFSVIIAFNYRPMDMAVKTGFYNDNAGRKIKVFFFRLRVIELANVFTLNKALRKAT